VTLKCYSVMLGATVHELQHITAVHSSITIFKTLEFHGGVVLPSFTLDSVYIKYRINIVRA
jgi:hypothetical protein